MINMEPKGTDGLYRIYSCWASAVFHACSASRFIPAELQGSILREHRWDCAWWPVQFLSPSRWPRPTAGDHLDEAQLQHVFVLALGLQLSKAPFCSFCLQLGFRAQSHCAQKRRGAPKHDGPVPVHGNRSL